MTLLLDRGLDTSGGTGFVGERLALLAKTLFLVSFGFWLFLLASLTLIGGADAFAVVRGPVALTRFLRSDVLAGRGVPHGDGSPVLVLPPAVAGVIGLQLSGSAH